METKIEYRSTIKSKAFLYLAQKKAAILKVEGLNDVQIKEKSVRENIFQVDTEERKKEVASMVLKRLKALDEYLLELLANGGVEKSKQIVLYSIMKSDRLFYEFMSEVYCEKQILRDPFLSDSDFNIFFRRKCEQSKAVASWGEYTLYKLKQVYLRILYEAGFIKNQKGNREISKPIIDKDLSQYLRRIGDFEYLNAMIGEI